MSHKVALRIEQALENSRVELMNLDEEMIPNWAIYDSVIVMSYTSFGEPQTRIQKFCVENRNMLLTKNLGLCLYFTNRKHAKRNYENAFLLSRKINYQGWCVSNNQSGYEIQIMCNNR